jgi:hypothetical protein
MSPLQAADKGLEGQAVSMASDAATWDELVKPPEVTKAAEVEKLAEVEKPARKKAPAKKKAAKKSKKKRKTPAKKQAPAGRSRARRRVSEAMPEIIDSIVEKAKKGSTQHAKFLLEHYPVVEEEEKSAEEQASLVERLLEELEGGAKPSTAEGTEQRG